MGVERLKRNAFPQATGATFTTWSNAWTTSQGTVGEQRFTDSPFVIYDDGTSLYHFLGDLYLPNGVGNALAAFDTWDNQDGRAVATDGGAIAITGVEAGTPTELHLYGAATANTINATGDSVTIETVVDVQSSGRDTTGVLQSAGVAIGDGTKWLLAELSGYDDFGRVVLSKWNSSASRASLTQGNRPLTPLGLVRLQLTATKVASGFDVAIAYGRTDADLAKTRAFLELSSDTHLASVTNVAVVIESRVVDESINFWGTNWTEVKA